MGLVPSPTVLSVDEMGRIAPPIVTSVGRDGVNAPGDVFVIQSLLNDRLPKPHAPVPVTGVADVGTTLAIEAYQAVIMNMTPPTGRVDPGSATYYSLAARPMVKRTAHAGRPFRQDTAGGHRCGCASASTGTCRLRSRWRNGRSKAPGAPPCRQAATIRSASRPVADQPAVERPTREVVNGESSITAKFRAFASLTSLRRARPPACNRAAYERCDEGEQDPEAFADALTGVYATDPALWIHA